MLDIVIPVYNEQENICCTIEEIEKKVRTPHNILVIYDFEQDNTLPIVRELMIKKVNLKLIKNRYGQGVLNAIKTGFASAKNEAVLVTMADLSDDLATVDRMYSKIANENYDIVCGSRYMCGGRQIGGPLFKRTMSRLAGFSLHYLTGIPTHDVTNSFKMYAKKLLDNIAIESCGGFELGMEITVKAFALGYQITEVPCTWRDRSHGQSKFKLWAWLPNYLHWYFYALRRRLFYQVDIKF
jgi:glycosyltransferase involved in cell wall biosynthesis